MSQLMFSVQEASDLIAGGAKVLVAGDEGALRRLPKGDWLGGTIPYFMAEAGGLQTRERVFVTRLPAFAAMAGIRIYEPADLGRLYLDIPTNGFGLVIIPASSASHLAFANTAPNLEGFASRPLIGWIAGIHLDDLGKATPKVVDGRSGRFFEEGVAVMHVTLPDSKAAEISILNIFQQGQGDVITFPKTGFEVTEAEINGERRNFADYVIAQKVDTRLPLVASYSGTQINVSFQVVDAATHTVKLYAPVFQGVAYRHAAPIADYMGEFTKQVPERVDADIAFSCNCILNYLYSELEGKRTPLFTGPITFGEIAYQLLNQTMVYLTISDVER
jgi:hypothetical protein